VKEFLVNTVEHKHLNPNLCFSFTFSFNITVLSTFKDVVSVLLVLYLQQQNLDDVPEYSLKLIVIKSSRHLC